ncbi:MAG: hypothetical protein GY715_03990 [Planctomycetes bacterium]|nr:hypothetical protein [Planctomycetota bacterium]
MRVPLSSVAAIVASALAVTLLTSAARAGALAVVSTSPEPNALAAPLATPVTIQFDRPVNGATVTSASVRVFGRWSGRAEGTYALSGGDQTLTFTPASPFSAGESVTVNLSHDLRAADGSPLRAAGYAFRFWTATRAACWSFELIDSMSNHSTPPAQTRIYGAMGADLDNDGWLDITTVNEVSADLRVFMNRADGSGLFDPWLQPPAPGLDEISPNEPADFDDDGNTDVCVASGSMDTVLVFLGNGDGTFGPATMIPVGDQPLGIAVLDADGDGDIDIVNGNRGSNNLSLHVNDGAAAFAPPVFFEGGVNGEYGIAAADMDNDGIFDIVVGGNGDQTVGVVRGNGDGTFTPIGSASCGGPVWQVGTGDVNGDGWEDVHTANSFAANGGVLINQGGGALAAATTYASGGHTPATDLGDFDGDGDLDWLLSAFGGGLWRVYENDGAGAFTASQDFPAPSNPACATAMDLDNDHRLDIVLLDEIADQVILMRNTVRTGDLNCDGVVSFADVLLLIGAWGPCPAPCLPECPADLNGDCTVSFADVLVLLGGWG